MTLELRRFCGAAVVALLGINRQIAHESLIPLAGSANTQETAVKPKDGEWHGKTAKGGYSGLKVNSDAIEYFAVWAVTHCGNKEPSGVVVFNGDRAKVSANTFAFTGKGHNACGELQVTATGKFTSDSTVSGRFRVTPPKGAVIVSEADATFQASAASK